MWSQIEHYFSRGYEILAPSNLYQDEAMIHKVAQTVVQLLQSSARQDKQVTIGFAQSGDKFNRYAVILSLSLEREEATASISMCIEPQQALGARALPQNSHIWISQPNDHIHYPNTIRTAIRASSGIVGGKICPENIFVSLFPFIKVSCKTKATLPDIYVYFVLEFIEAVLIKKNVLSFCGLDASSFTPLVTEASTFLGPKMLFFFDNCELKLQRSVVGEFKCFVGSYVQDQANNFETFHLNRNILLSQRKFQKMCKHSDTRMVNTIIKDLTFTGNIVFRKSARRFPGRHVAYALVQFFLQLPLCVEVSKSRLSAVLEYEIWNRRSPSSFIDAVDIFHVTVLTTLITKFEANALPTKEPYVVSALLDCLSIFCVAYVHMAPVAERGMTMLSAAMSLSLVLLNMCKQALHVNRNFSCFLYTDSTVLYVFGDYNIIKILNFHADTSVEVKLPEVGRDHYTYTNALSTLKSLLVSLGVQGAVFELSIIRDLFERCIRCKTMIEDTGLAKVSDVKNVSRYIETIWIGEDIKNAVYECVSGSPPDGNVTILPYKEVGGVMSGSDSEHRNMEKIWDAFITTIEVVAYATACPEVNFVNDRGQLKCIVIPTIETSVHCMRVAKTKGPHPGSTLERYVASTAREKIQVRNIVAKLQKMSLAEFSGTGYTEGSSNRLSAEICSSRAREDVLSLAQTEDYNTIRTLSLSCMVPERGGLAPMLIVDKLEPLTLQRWVPQWSKLSGLHSVSETRVSNAVFSGIDCVMSVFMWIRPVPIHAGGGGARAQISVELSKEVRAVMDELGPEVHVALQGDIVKLGLGLFARVALALKRELCTNSTILNQHLDDVIMGVFIAHPVSHTTLTITTTNMSAVCVPAASVCVASRDTVSVYYSGHTGITPIVCKESIPVVVTQGSMAVVHVMTPTLLAHEWVSTPLYAVSTGCPCFGVIRVNGDSPCSRAFASMDTTLNRASAFMNLSVKKITNDSVSQWFKKKGANLEVDVARGMRLTKALRLQVCLASRFDVVRLAQEAVCISLAEFVRVVLPPSHVGVSRFQLAQTMRRGMAHTSSLAWLLFPNDGEVWEPFLNAVIRLREGLDASVLRGEDPIWKIAMERVVLFRLMCLVVMASRASHFKFSVFVESIDDTVSSDTHERVETLGPDDERATEPVRSLFNINSTILAEEGDQLKKYLFFPTTLVEAILKDHFMYVPCFIPGNMERVVSLIADYAATILDLKVQRVDLEKLTVAVRNTIDFLRQKLEL